MTKCDKPVHIGWPALLAVCAAILATGCKWEKDKYSSRMEQSLANWERNEELRRLLGDPFSGPAEFPVWIRPPQPTKQVQAPEEFIGWFQGSNPPGPLIEMVVIGSMGVESVQEFETKAFAALDAKQMGPGAQRDSQPAVEVDCMWGGKINYEVFQAQGNRGAVLYHWFYFVAEENQQKVMIAFLIPDPEYTNMTNPLDKCLQSLALSSKVGIAQAGGAGAAPAGR